MGKEVIHLNLLIISRKNLNNIQNSFKVQFFFMIIKFNQFTEK